MSEGYIVYVEVSNDEEFVGSPPYRNIFLSLSAESIEEAVEKATEEFPLRVYKRISSIRACAVDDLKELARW